MPDEKKSDFAIAGEITELLRIVAEERRPMVLRWVAEGLNLPGATPSSSPQGLPLPASHANASDKSTSSAGHGVLHPPDIKSFVEQKAPTSDVQFAAVVAYYYRFCVPAGDRRDTISAKELQEATRHANRKRFKKPLVPLSNAKGQGYFDSPERGRFRLNSIGENLVAMTLPGSPEAHEQRRRRSKVKEGSEKRSRRHARRPSRG